MGQPALETSRGRLALERKTAAVLAYLAFEGATAKYKLAGWLWPDSGEPTARNNMRQLLRRLRLLGVDIIRGDDHLELRPDVVVDIKQLASPEAPTLESLQQEARLLEGLDYDDAPDFAEWLEATREELHSLRARAAALEASRLERLGDFRRALDFALVRLKADPLSEEACRQVAQLHYLLGDRGAALAVIERCQRVLAAELGTEPLPATLELMRLIKRGDTLPDAAKPAANALPLSILRPPLLVGREREWALMDEAWQAGKMIFLRGEPGVGKTRLATEFLAGKGSFLRLSGRPGDVHVPYAANVRHLRAILQRYPEEALSPWVRQTLAPWLPELWPRDDLPEGPLERSSVSQARFFEAHRELFGILVRHHEAILVDDLQFHDEASTRMGAYLLGEVAPLSASGLRGYIGLYRSAGETTAHMDAFIGELVSAGMAVLLELEPLGATSVESLLESLGLAEAHILSPELSRYTGGNPLFILETLKQLLESGDLPRGLPAHLTPPGQLGPLIQRRLQRLSPTARDLARVAAVAGSHFSLELAAHVLERNPLELAGQLDELEAAGVLPGSSFPPKVILEAVVDAIPPAARQLLHSRTARFLEAREADPAFAQQHQASRPGDTASWWFGAAETAASTSRYDEPAYARAAKRYDQRYDQEDRLGQVSQALHAEAKRDIRLFASANGGAARV